MAKPKTRTPTKDNLEVTSTEIVLQEVIDIDQEENILSDEERALLTQLEKTVYSTLNEAAYALKEIRDKKLFRETHLNFNEYCEETLQISKRFANYQILFATILDTFKEREQDVPILPTSESQVRALGSYKPDEQVEIWQMALEKTEGRVPSREVVQEVVKEKKLQKIRQQNVKNALNVDDCVRITGTHNPSHSAYKNCWGFIREVNDAGYVVELPHAILSPVNPLHVTKETLNGAELTKPQVEVKRAIFEQIKGIYNKKDEDSEDIIEAILPYFLTLKTKYLKDSKGKETNSVKLTSFEQRVLNGIKKEVAKE